MTAVSRAASAVPASGIREISHLAMRRPAAELIRLELGEPGARSAPHIVRAAVEASRGRTGYTASAGTAELRSAVAERVHRAYGLSSDEQRVVLGLGAVQLLSCILAATVAPGEEVLIPNPGWPNYEMQALLVGGRPVPYPVRADNDFRPLTEDIAASVSARTKVLIVNSPANPTGGMLDEDAARDLVEFAVGRGILVVSDEVYDEIVYDGAHVNLASLDPENVVSVFSFSKTYAMTGWRVGYASFPTWLAETIAKLQEAFLSSLPSASQAAALAALRGPQDAVAVNLAAYRRNRDEALRLLSAAGVAPVAPRGAFYLMVPLALGADSRQCAIDLVGRGVATAPGSAFGTQTKSHLRISLASDPGDLTVGLDRLVDWYAATDGGLAPPGTRHAGATEIHP